MRAWQTFEVIGKSQTELAERIAELEDVLLDAEIVIRMLAPTGQETTLETIRRALRRDAS